MTSAAIIGFGYCGPFGFGWDAFLQLARGSLQGDPSGSTSGEPDRIAAGWPAPFPPCLEAREWLAPENVKSVLEGRGLRAFNREGKLLAAACAGALAEANDPHRLQPDDTGLFAGSSSAGLDDYSALCLERELWGVARLTPSRGPNAGYNAHLGHVSKWFDLRGVTLGIAAGRCSGSAALSAAERELGLGTVSTAVAGAVEARAHLRLQGSHESARVAEGALAFVLVRASNDALATITSAGEYFIPDTEPDTLQQVTGWLQHSCERLAGTWPPYVIVSGLSSARARQSWQLLRGQLSLVRYVLDVDARWGDWLGASSSLAAALALALVSGRLVLPDYDGSSTVAVVSLDEQGAILLHLVGAATRTADN